MPGRIMGTGYRFGYQGKFAEKDEETGLNEFELRLFDARIGRWLTTDPYNQYWSPYIGMGNDPILFVDSDGGWGGRHAAKKSAKEHNGSFGQYQGQWVSWYKDDNRFFADGNGITYDGLAVDFHGKVGYFGRVFSYQNGQNWLKYLDNNFYPDYITIGGGYNFVGILGANSSIEVNWIIKGKYKSFVPIVTITPSVQAGWNISETTNIGYGFYNGDGDMMPGYFETNIGKGNVGLTVSGGFLLVGATNQVSPVTGHGSLNEFTINIGPSEGIYTGSSGTFNSFILNRSVLNRK